MKLITICRSAALIISLIISLTTSSTIPISDEEVDQVDQVRKLSKSLDDLRQFPRFPKIYDEALGHSCTAIWDATLWKIRHPVCYANTETGVVYCFPADPQYGVYYPETGKRKVIRHTYDPPLYIEDFKEYTGP